ncbi:MAG: 3'-5' exonuclease [Polyangiales bacterium]
MSSTEPTELSDDDDPGEEPPRGAPWDLPLAECPLVFIDCEMTGLDPERDRLVEVAMLRVKNGAPEARFASLINGGVASHPDALAVHGITDAQAAEGPTFDVVSEDIAAILEGAVPVMHDAGMDAAFLDRAFAEAGSDRRVGACVDTLLLARRAVKAPRYGLGSLCAALGLPPVRWHRASEDVMALRALWSPLIERLKPVSARDLWQVRVGQRGRVRVRDAIAARFAESAGRRRLLSVVYRTPGRDPVTLRARVERWAEPHVWLVPEGRGARGLRVLRADRVLHAVEV